MARGRPALDAETKAKRRKESLQRYAAKNGDSLRLAAQKRMKLLRARQTETEGTSTKGEISPVRLRARASAAKYREMHRDKIRAADALRRAEYYQVVSYLTAHGSEAFDEKRDRPHMVQTQKRHEGRPPPRRPRARANGVETQPLRIPRRNPNEVVTENQKRCRALRKCGFEEDNGEDSDADLPPGICGCDLTECQRTHKNETQDRQDWKIFHVREGQQLAKQSNIN
ncbi:hypothetical protein B0H13DRAFT_1916196 [Mycena leptocephala]|nr:hypothetical protein B0H13DRAFT_1916196 [Mycena leptocephala]